MIFAVRLIEDGQQNTYYIIHDVLSPFSLRITGRKTKVQHSSYLVGDQSIECKNLFAMS